MKLIFALALVTCSSVALAQPHDHAPDAPATAQKSEPAVKPSSGSCPMMDNDHNRRMGKGAPDSGMGRGGKDRMGSMGGKGSMPMQESCPMMSKGAQAASPEASKAPPGKDGDHAESH